ncbi:hypothetical protein FSP39_020842 [Pinctada imbricata]|uniref:Uncharacterized protein n=1 Tax=Pinctada imbricata TaxID=66713 RepID=A0AA88Y134_PINIB|nr:hypothetical protein FSP39_020842 [Pinctada imbricata]
MNNEAAPSYFNGGTYQQYMDYRCYVISCLPKLEVLDDKKIEENERSEAERIYPRKVCNFLNRLEGVLDPEISRFLSPNCLHVHVLISPHLR